MFQRRTIITLIFLFIIYLGVVYAARQRKVTPKCLQPAAKAWTTRLLLIMGIY